MRILGNLTPSEYLADKGIKPLFARKSIFQYMLEDDHGHLTVNQIYKALREDIPTLSKTTVYSTLKLFDQAGIVRAVNVGDGETRYEIKQAFHGHFQCMKCGEIYDVEVNLDIVDQQLLTACQIDQTSVTLKGLCAKCKADYGGIN